MRLALLLAAVVALTACSADQKRERQIDEALRELCARYRGGTDPILDALCFNEAQTSGGAGGEGGSEF